MEEVTKCPCCNSPKIIPDLDYPKTMLGCTQCGADFTVDGEILLDPRLLK